MAPFPTDPHFPASSERHWYRGIVLASMGYGISITLFIACVNRLIGRLNAPETSLDPKRRGWIVFSLLYVCIMFGCSTVSIVSEVITGEKAYIDSREAPFGPSGYFLDHTFGQHITILKAAYISLLLCNWGATGLMMWRCLVIFRCSSGGEILNKRGIPRWILYLLVPWVLMLGSIVTGTIFVVQAISPLTLPEAIRSMKWIVIFGSNAVALQWTLTGMIAIRLLLHRQDVRKILGDRYCLKYTSIATMLIESSGILSSFSVFFLVAFSLNSPVMVTLPFIVTQVQVISPLLIMYRVASGRAWTRHAVPNFESLPTFSVSIQPGHTEADLIFPPSSTAAITSSCGNGSIQAFENKANPLGSITESATIHSPETETQRGRKNRATSMSTLRSDAPRCECGCTCGGTAASGEVQEAGVLHAP